MANRNENKSRGESRDSTYEKGSMQSAHGGNLGSQIASLQRFGENYANKIEQERANLELLDAKIHEVEEKLKEQRNQQRKKFKEAHTQKDSNEDIRRKIKTLENQLDKQRQKFNQGVAHNKQLRDQIDSLRRERVVFDKIYKNLEKELKKKQDKMVKTIGTAEEAFIKRKFAQLHMLDIKKTAEEEKNEFEDQWNEIQEMIQKNKQMQQYIKSQEESKISKLESQETKNLVELKNQEKQLRETLDHSMDKVREYEKALKNIKQKTGINNINELVQKFIDAESDNVSLFTYVNELNADMEKLEKEISDKKLEIDKYKGHGIIIDDHRKEMVDGLKRKLKETDDRIIVYREKYDDTIKTIKGLKLGIKSIYESLGCEVNKEGEEPNAEITESNMMHFLGIIEERTNEILEMYQLCNKGGFDKNNMGNTQEERETLQSIEMPLLSQADKEPEGYEDDVNLLISKKDFRSKVIQKMDKEEKTNLFSKTDLLFQ